MIVMDLDGTLLTSVKGISDYTLSILEKCKTNGIKIVTASGRSERAGRRILDLVQPDFMILNGGSLVKDNNGRIIYKRLLSIKTSNGLLNECVKNQQPRPEAPPRTGERAPGFKPFAANKNIGNIKAETEENDYVSYETPPDHQDYMHEKYYDFSKQLFKETYKISVEVFNRKILPMFKNKFTECKVMEYPGDSLCEFYPKDAGKMEAIEAISKTKDIKISDIIAFGNDYNDIEMIKGCGTGIAVENGVEEIKKSAKYICGKNNEDGIAKWIEKNLLQTGKTRCV
jgi:Cof subfamily protein (haloacid dehalogenase superfamily)